MKRTLWIGLALAPALFAAGPAGADIPTRQVTIESRIIEAPVLNRLGVDIFGGYEFVSRDFRESFGGGSFSETADFHTFLVGGSLHYGATTLTGSYQGSFSESGVIDDTLKAFELSLSHRLITTPRLVGGTPVLIVAPHVEFNHDRVGDFGFDAVGFGAGVRFYPRGPDGRVSFYAGASYFPIVNAHGFGGDLDGDDGVKVGAGVHVKVPSLSGVATLGYLFRRTTGSGSGFDHRQTDHRVQLLFVITPRVLNPAE